MKHFILTFAGLILCLVGMAQNPAPQTSQTEPESEWLQNFSRIEISGPMDVVLIAVAKDQAPKIIFDTKGAYTSKFRYAVKERVLRLSERADARRPERTAVTIYYNDLTELSVSDANVTCQEVLASNLMDLYIDGQSSFQAELDVKDLRMNLSGHSNATLCGTARYMTLWATSGSVEASELEVMAATIEAKSSARVKAFVTERIEAKTAMKGSITFRGKPSIVRGAGVRFMGGDIVGVE